MNMALKRPPNVISERYLVTDKFRGDGSEGPFDPPPLNRAIAPVPFRIRRVRLVVLEPKQVGLLPTACWPAPDVRLSHRSQVPTACLPLLRRIGWEHVNT